jgi:hypothetical protein
VDHFCLWEGGSYFSGDCEGYVKGGSGNGPLQTDPFGDLEGGSLTRDFERQMEGSGNGASPPSLPPLLSPTPLSLSEGNLEGVLFYWVP